MKKLYQGAEAILYQHKGVLVKDRIAKGYRIPELDQRIRRQRTRLEARVMEQARRGGMAVPEILEVGESKLCMEFIAGERIKDTLDAMSQKRRIGVAEKIGTVISELHKNGIVHGDLTTSNMILFKGKVYLIDFGLAKRSSRREDQAVDLFLLHEALTSAHFSCFQEVWDTALNVYKHKYHNSKEVLRRFETIATRRRYKR